MLGPLEVTVGGRPVRLTTGRLRTLLAVLAMSAGEIVSLDRMATAMWGAELPANVRRTVQTYLTRLRGLLGAELIGTRPEGYVLHATPDQVDALRFGRLVDAAAAAPDPSEERSRLAEALALWRGLPFEGLRSAWLEGSEAPRLVEQSSWSAGAAPCRWRCGSPGPGWRRDPPGRWGSWPAGWPTPSAA